mmetsp:Transcript_35649/g.40944  ORF Transcript_35649/g.40944 Transcript_35649/m.40944 type:complete len:551 (+) Transcript_35649:60-1712(+)
MKFFPKILFTIGAILSVVAAVDFKTDSTTTRQLDERKSWDTGTKVYNEFPNEGWWSGTITLYNPDTQMYTVTWEDGSTDYYDDDDMVDQMVAYAQNDPQNNPAGAPANAVPGTYPAGTDLSMFENGIWYDGVIVNFGTDVYTVKWNDSGEVEQIQAGAVMDQMVVDATGTDDAAPAGYEGGPVSPTASVPVGENNSNLFVGTPVSYFDDDDEDWQDGTITGYHDTSYTVMWQDGSVDTYSDFGTDLQELKQAVEDAYGTDDTPPSGSDNVPQSGPQFPNKTPVRDFEDGEWVDGEVVLFKDGNYIVQWNDEEDAEYYASSNAEDMQTLKKMVDNATSDDDAAPADFVSTQELWEGGTRVAFAEDGVWYMGTITGFSNNEYKIKWDDGVFEIEDDLDLVNQMVADVVTNSPSGQQKNQEYATGQVVYAEFDEGEWYVGRIIMFNDARLYTVRWSDGDHILYKQEDLKSMVKAARYIPDDEDAIIDGPAQIGMSAAGKSFLSLFIIAVCVVASIFGYKFYEKRQIQIKRERELALEGDADYRDEPTDLPKII